MKKLLKYSAMAFILFIAASCEKENPAPPAPVPMVMEASTSFTAPGATKPTIVKGDIEEGVRGITYTIKPVLNVCNCAGIWTFKVAELNNNQYSGGVDKRNGEVRFMSMLSGTYKITITFTCPDGSSVSTTVSITVK